MKVKILEAETASLFEDKINQEIEKLEYDWKEVVDVKFITRKSCTHIFYAMIIYKDKDLAQ